MEDPTDLFTQLAQLHAQGLLTDAEYEEKKAALRSRRQSGDLPPSPDRSLEKVTSFMASYRRNTRPWFLASVILTILIGGYFLIKASTTSPRFAAASASHLNGDSGPWTIESTTDPMTDATVKSAKATFEGSQFNFEVAVSCASTGELTYTATSYDRDGKPAEMRSEMDNSGHTYLRFQMRVDSDPTFDGSTTDPQYNNQIVLRGLLGDFVAINLFAKSPSFKEVGLAKLVRLRLFMTNGDETIQLPQDSAGFRGVIDSCLQQQPNPIPSATPTPVAAAESSDAGSFADASSEGANNAASKRKSDKSCEADVLYEVASVEDSSSKMEAGTTFDYVTQFRRNKQTGETTFCQHGGYCYPTHVVIGGKKIEAIRLNNCSVGKQNYDDDEDVFYDLR